MHEEVHYSHSADIPGLILGTARFTNFRFEPHYHLDCHVGLVTSGVQRQTFRGESLYLTRGVIQLMPAGEVHDGVAEGNEEYVLRTFRLSPELLNGLGEDITGRHHFPTQAATVLRDDSLADRLLDAHLTLEHGGHDPIKSATSILEMLETLFAHLKQPVPQTIAGTLSLRQLQLVREYAEAHLGDKILLEELSLLVGLSPFRFLKLFKRTVGMTPHAWLLRMRLEKAVTLIKEKKTTSLTEIAYAVGFFDQSHFTRAFRQAYGVTPTQFW
ncbi:AraC family transcriptional regulator [Paraburkholderia sp. C35]|uniref:AraC family transcriptional regulator n=1 Tax=Paraburkholderia sp. C35 TaxID=2126993 RepID=UPI000D690B9A|nr:AraC family transcriptional regulator [Paraburkholderia sp. C35]